MNDDEQPDWYLPDEEPVEEYQTEDWEWALLALVVTGIIVVLCCWGMWIG